MHDFKVETWGICLRADALRRSTRTDNPGLDNALRKLAEVLERLETFEPPQIVQRYAPPYAPPKPVNNEKPTSKGGTPLPP